MDCFVKTCVRGGLAAPTGTGKSFLTQVLIADLLLSDPKGLVLYLVPSKALVYEVSKRLNDTFKQLDFRVTAITPALVGLDQEEEEAIEQSSVLVLTPEKADLLVRISDRSFDRTRLVVVDEAHHIESGTRGVLLEMYLWRLKSLVKTNARFVFLSAVTPNIKELTEWLGTPSQTVVHVRRPTRMRVAVYRISRVGRYNKGLLDYGAEGQLVLIEKDVEKSKRRQLVQLAEALGVAGSVLIVARGKGECENLAKEMAKRIDVTHELTPEEWNSDEIQRLDSRLERELYKEVPMRQLLRSRVVYHHAGLPPRVRTTVEDAIRAGFVRYVFATTTLAEGVNFPFSSVVVQSLALRNPPRSGRPSSYSPVTPRVFWNIAGRAGRPGTDREGQVILFEPSLGIEAIEYVLGDYLNPDLRSITPVASALGDGLKAIVSELDSGTIQSEWIVDTHIDRRTPPRIQGTLNLIRVSLIHARATRRLSSPEEILEGTFATQFLDDESHREAIDIVLSQDRVVSKFLSEPTAPTVEIAAELGLSIQTLDDLRAYALSLTDWQIERFSTILRNGYIVQNQIEFLVAPVVKRMGEMEGDFLGAFATELVRQWILGVPFSALRQSQQRKIEELVSVVYSRIQYLLPWGLYAFDRLIQEEADRRSIPYNNGIRSIAYLVDAGVPGFNPLRLTNLDIERVDATRLAARYRQLGGFELGMDVVRWVSTLSEQEIRSIVAGRDARRIDYDLLGLVTELKNQ